MSAPLPCESNDLVRSSSECDVTAQKRANFKINQPSARRDPLDHTHSASASASPAEVTLSSKSDFVDDVVCAVPETNISDVSAKLSATRNQSTGAAVSSREVSTEFNATAHTRRDAFCIDTAGNGEGEVLGVGVKRGLDRMTSANSVSEITCTASRTSVSASRSYRSGSFKRALGREHSRGANHHDHREGRGVGYGHTAWRHAADYRRSASAYYRDNRDSSSTRGRSRSRSRSCRDRADAMTDRIRRYGRRPGSTERHGKRRGAASPHGRTRSRSVPRRRSGSRDGRSDDIWRPRGRSAERIVKRRREREDSYDRSTREGVRSSPRMSADVATALSVSAAQSTTATAWVRESGKRFHSDLPLEWWERAEDCKEAKAAHTARVDHMCDSRESLVLKTTLWREDTVLEPNMFPYWTPRGVEHYTLWSIHDLEHDQVVAFVDQWLTQRMPHVRRWQYDDNAGERSIDLFHVHVFIETAPFSFTPREGCEYFPPHCVPPRPLDL